MCCVNECVCILIITNSSLGLWVFQYQCNVLVSFIRNLCCDLVQFFFSFFFFCKEKLNRVTADNNNIVKITF